MTPDSDLICDKCGEGFCEILDKSLADVKDVE